MNNQKERFKTFCENVYVPIFSKPWWLDVVCGENNWDVFMVNINGNDVAAMPYYFITDDGNLIITKAKLTQNNGIIIKYPANQSYSKRLDFEEKIINCVCDYLETLNIKKYEQQYHYCFDNWLPFFWRYYKEIVRYTYVIEDTKNMNVIEKNFTSEARNMLRKAKKLVSVVEDNNIEEFYRINELTYERQGIETPFSKQLIKNLYEACRKRNCAKMCFAIDKNGNLHSAAMLVWDENSVYYLINGTDPQFKNSQANTLLIYHGIECAHDLNKSFDFEGSVIKPVENAFRQFGGKRKLYFRIFKEYNIEEQRQ